MGKNIQILLAGVVTIGIITALVLPGRNTVGGITAAGNAGSNLLGTAIKG
jgi:hypothetical protein